MNVNSKQMRITIQYKITLLIGVIVAIILFGVYLYLNSVLKAYTYDRVKMRLHSEARTLQPFFEGLPNRQVEAQMFDDIADEIGKNLQRRVTIIARNGVVLGDSDLDGEKLIRVDNHILRPEIVQALKSGTGESKRFSSTTQKDMLYVAYLFGREEPHGVIRLSSPLVEIELLSHQLKKLLIISLLLAFVFTTVISFVVSLFITRPMKAMSSIAANIAGGDFSKRIIISSNDEIGDMAAAFNHMVRQIKSKLNETTLGKLRLEAVLLSMFEGVMVVDIKGAILLMNQALKDFLLIKGDVIGKKPLEVTHNITIQEIADNALIGKQKVESREISIFSGSEKILLVHATPVLRNARVEGGVLIFHDITELRRLEKVRQEFVANVSHELRTPMASIKGYTETLLEGAINDDKNAAKFLRIIHNESDRMANLIDDILDLARTESGRLKLDITGCHVNSVISGIIGGLSKLAQNRLIVLNKDVPDDIHYVYADESRLSQILLNLLDNAIKYNREGGEVVVTARDVGNFIQIAVKDDGIGIAANDKERIFERFYRVEKGRSRELGGTGLGLSIVKHLVQAHNGELFVESEVGKGSTFSFTIPKYR